MRIISKKALIDFWESHANAKATLEAWYFEAKNSDWNDTHDIKKRYQSADFLEDNRVVFNIGGNKYRLIIKINFHIKTIYIRFVGTHAEYDKINAKEV